MSLPTRHLLVTLYHWLTLPPGAQLIRTSSADPAEALGVARRAIDRLRAADRPELVIPLVGEPQGDAPEISWTRREDTRALEAQAIEILVDDPRLQGLVAELVRDRLLTALQDTPAEDGYAVLDGAGRDAVLAGLRAGLLPWAAANSARRRGMRLAALAGPTRAALAGKPSPARTVLEPAHRPLPMGLLPSHLLRPAHEVTPFLGRAPELTALLAWCASSGPSTGRLVVGPTGCGRTRLGIELCRTLEEQGWTAGFLKGDLEEGWLERLVEAPGDRLVVIDDAASRPDVLRTVLAVSRRAQIGRLRVLALSRAEGAWWPEDESPTLALRPVPLAERDRWFQAALGSLAACQGQQPPRLLALPDLEQLRWPQDLQMAAAVALQGQRPETGAPLVKQVLAAERRAWQGHPGIHEAVIQHGLGGDLGEAALLYGPEGLQPAALLEALLAEGLQEMDPAALLALEKPADLRRCLRMLGQLASQDPTAQRWLRRLLAADLPGRLDTALSVAMETARSPEESPIGLALAALVPALPWAPRPGRPRPLRALSLLLRAQHLPPDSASDNDLPPQRMELAVGAQSAYAHVTGQAWQGPSKDRREQDRAWGQLWPRLDVLLPHQLQALESLADGPQETLAAQRLSLLLQLGQQRPLAAHIECALNDMGVRLCVEAPACGQPLAAPADLVESLRAAARRLQDQGPSARMMARQQLTAIQELLGQLPEGWSGQAAIAEIVDVCSGLWQPGEALAALQALLARLTGEGAEPAAMLWINLSLLYLLAQQPAAAAAAAGRAVIEAGEGASLARIFALHHQALIDELIGRAKAAKDTLERAAADARRLEAQAPELYRPYLAALLDQRSRWLQERGERGAAIRARQEAARALGGLSARDSALFAPFLGISLLNLGVRLRAAGLAGPGVDTTLDAADAYRQQARLGGDLFLPDLAGALCNLGAMLTSESRMEEACALLRKGVGMCWGGTPYAALAQMPGVETFLRPHAPMVPAAAPPALLLLERAVAGVGQRQPYACWPWSLLAAELERGPDEEETDLSGLMARLWREQAGPGAMRPVLALALHNLGGALANAGRPEVGREAAAGAVLVLRALSVQQPSRYGLALALALDNLSALCGLCGEREQALSSAREAVALLRGAGEDLVLPDLARALVNLSAALLELGCYDPARAAAEEALGMLPEEDDPLLVLAQHNLALALDGDGQPGPARQAALAALSALPTAPARFLSAAAEDILAAHPGVVERAEPALIALIRRKVRCRVEAAAPNNAGK